MPLSKPSKIIQDPDIPDLNHPILHVMKQTSHQVYKLKRNPNFIYILTSKYNTYYVPSGTSCTHATPIEKRNFDRWNENLTVICLIIWIEKKRTSNISKIQKTESYPYCALDWRIFDACQISLPPALLLPSWRYDDKIITKSDPQRWHFNKYPDQ